jgi:RHS repeat-associated protein
MVNGIELDSGGKIVQAINCGELAGGTITVAPSTFTNQGSVQAQNGETLAISGLAGNLGDATVSGNGSSLSLSGTNYVVNQRLTATAGQTLTLDGTWSNAAGSAISATGATLNLGDSDNAWSNQGTITATNSAVSLGGALSLAHLGSFTRSGGNVNLTGVFDNTATTLAFTAATGSWNLVGGTISGGTVTEADGAELTFTNSGGTLAGVTFDNNLDVANHDVAYATVTGGLTLTGATVLLGNAAGTTYGVLEFNATQTLGGSGTVILGKGGSNELYVASGTLTIASGITVAGSSGYINGGGALVNQGTISANDSGGLTSPFVYDTDFSGGNTGSTPAPIGTRGVTNPAPQAVYQTYRSGSFSYTLTGLTPSASYTLRLHFADPNSTAAGQRQFDVSVNGSAALTNFDIYAAAGAADQAVVESIPATASAQGQVTIAFNYDAAGTPMVNGIELDSGGKIVQAINCGELAGGTITVSPATFTNQGSIQAAATGVLDVSPTTWTTPGTIEADTGGLIKIAGDLSLTPTSQVNVQVSGTTAGSFGLIMVAGSAALNGTLNVLTGTGVSFDSGAAIQVMSFASATENFVNVTGTAAGRYVFFVETLGDTAVTLTTATTSEDLAASSITINGTGIAGQDVNVRYTVDNLSSMPVSGDWFDSIYLTEGTTLDATAVLLTRVERTTTVPADGSYTVTLSVPLPGLLPGSYHPILFVDSRSLLPDADRSNNLLVSTSTIQVSTLSLRLNSSASTTVAAGQTLYYNVDIPAGHDVAFTADAMTAGAAEMYVQVGGPPTPSDYEKFAFSSTTPDDEVDLTGTMQGTYYILVQGEPDAGSGQALTVTVRDEPFSLRGVSETAADTGAPFTATLTGFQFSPQIMASLVNSAGKQLPAQSVTYIDRNTLYATFEVPLFDDGTYSVQVQQSGQTSTLPNAVTATTQPNSAQATLAMSAPQYVSSSTSGFITVTYANDTGHDIPAPLLNVTANNALLRLPDQSSFISNKAEFLGIDTTGPAGVLPPGARGQLIIYFKVDITEPASAVSFNLYPSLDYYNIGDAGQTQFTMDWASVESEFRPSSIPIDAWDAIWSNFLASVGNNVAEFHTRLDIDANYLSQFGDYVYDIGTLLNFELGQANDDLPSPTLTSAVDASTSAPGSLSFSFTRQFSQQISGRYTPGPLGLGWVDNWDLTLRTDSAGSVTIDEYGESVPFELNANGSYAAGSGDTAQLTLVNGDYRLFDPGMGTTAVFSSQGELLLVEDTHGNTITMGYTGGEFTSLTDSDRQVIAIAYNSAGLIKQITDPAGQVTSYAYDASDQHLLSVTGPQGITSYTYITGQSITQDNALASITLPDGTHEYFSYDANGRLIETSLDGGAEAIHYAYTFPGGVTMTDAAGDMTSMLLNQYGQLQMEVDPLGNTTQLQYNTNQDVTQLTTAAGTSYQYTYDQNGNLVREVGPLGDTVTMTHSSSLNLMTSITDADGNTTKYAYDSSGDLTSTTYADRSSSSAAYNALGLPTTSTNADGQAIGYQYNAAGQVTEETFADGTDESLTYDKFGNLVSTTDATGTTDYSYNSANQLTKVAYPSGESLLYTYNSGGQLIRLVDSSSGFTVNYSYNDLGQLQTLTDASGNSLVTYQYDPVGRLAEQTNGNGTYTTYSHDADGNVLDLINYGPGGVIQSSFAYTYNDLNECTTEATTDGTWTYTYDAAGELTNAVFASTNPGVPDQSLAYVYDAAGNRVQTIINGTTTNYTTNERNEYTTVGGTTYRYDADGNLISETNSSGTTRFTYNSLNELIKVVTPTDTWIYQYNALGERVSAVHNGQQITYVLDPTGNGSVIAAYDSTNNLVADYAYGLGLAMQAGATGGDYYQFDALGNTAALTNSSGAIVNRYSYLPFGSIQAQSGTVTNPFQFAGRWGVQTSTDLSLMTARYYSDALGTFLSADPAGLKGGDPNLRLYVWNDPISNVDPSGLGAISLSTISNISSVISTIGTVDTLLNSNSACSLLVGLGVGAGLGILGGAIGVGAAAALGWGAAAGTLTILGPIGGSAVGSISGLGAGFAIGELAGNIGSLLFSGGIADAICKPPPPPPLPLPPPSPPVPYGTQPADT